jgi:RNA polymerase sigma-70 factor (ECF subfamily)
VLRNFQSPAKQQINRGDPAGARINPRQIWACRNNLIRIEFLTEEIRQIAQLMNEDNEMDADLLHRVASGDGAAFHQLVDRHADRLYRVAISLVGNVADAEDVLQEALAGAFRGAGQFEGRASVKSWLTRIVVTQAAKFWRSRKGKRDRPIETDVPLESGGEASVDAKLDLQACLQQLSEEHRQVLVLREIDGLGYEEIAQVLSVPRGTIESRLFRARAELKKRLKGYLPED